MRFPLLPHPSARALLRQRRPFQLTLGRGFCCWSRCCQSVWSEKRWLPCCGEELAGCRLWPRGVGVVAVRLRHATDKLRNCDATCNGAQLGKQRTGRKKNPGKAEGERVVGKDSSSKTTSQRCHPHASVPPPRSCMLWAPVRLDATSLLITSRGGCRPDSRADSEQILVQRSQHGFDVHCIPWNLS